MSKENTRVFIGNIYYTLTPADLRIFFSPAGLIQKLDLFVDEFGKSRGCGIIHFSNKAEAQRAISMFNGTELHSRIITVKEDETFYNQLKPTQITIKGMPSTVTWQQLKDVCRDMGEVLRADVRVMKNGTSTGNVLFNIEEDAVRAVKLLNGAIFNGMKVEAFCNFDN